MIITNIIFDHLESLYSTVTSLSPLFWSHLVRLFQVSLFHLHSFLLPFGFLSLLHWFPLAPCEPLAEVTLHFFLSFLVTTIHIFVCLGSVRKEVTVSHYFMAYMLTMAATRRDAAMVLESKKVRGQTQFLSHTKKITKRVARAKKVRGFSGPPNVDGRGGPIWEPISLENVIFC